MSVLGKIVSAIFGHANAAPAPAPSAPAAPVAPSGSSAPSATVAPSGSSAPSASTTPKGSSTPTGAPTAPVDVAAILTELAASNKEKLDWQKSIVDLMKLLNLNSSLAARKSPRSFILPATRTIPRP